MINISLCLVKLFGQFPYSATNLLNDAFITVFTPNYCYIEKVWDREWNGLHVAYDNADELW